MDNESSIPSLSMWQTFSDTIITLTNSKPSETKVKKLINVIKWEELLKILVYDQNPILTYEQSNLINDKYKSFTLWVLGRFFYLLGQCQLDRVHDLIVKVHVKILDYIINRLPDVYVDLTQEYVNVLDMLANYEMGKTLTLTAFIPSASTDINHGLNLSQVFIEIVTYEEYLNILKNTLKILEYVLIKNLSLYKLHLTKEIVDLLLKITRKSTLEAKIFTLELYIEVLISVKSETLNEFDSFPPLLEKLLYEVYDKKLDHTKFDDLFHKYFEHQKNNPCTIRMAKYVIEEHLQEHLESAIEVLSLYSNILPQKTIDSLLNIHPSALKILKQQIFMELETHKTSKHLVILQGHVFKLLSNSNLNYSTLLIALEALIQTITYIKFCLPSFSTNSFNELSILLLKCIEHHQRVSTTEDVEQLLKIFARLPILCNENAEMWLWLILTPFFKRIRLDLATLQTNENFVKHLKSIASSLNFNENISVRYSCLFISLLDSEIVNCDGNIDNMKTYFLKFINYCLEENNKSAQKIIIDYLPDIIRVFPELDQNTMKNIYNLTINQDDTIIGPLSNKMQKIFCILTNRYVKRIEIVASGEMKITVLCTKCDLNIKIDDVNRGDLLAQLNKRKDSDKIKFFSLSNYKRNDNLLNVIYNSYRTFLTSNRPEEVVLNSIFALKNMSSHVVTFYAAKNYDLWLAPISSNNKDNRTAICEVIYYIYSNFLENPKFSKEKSQEILNSTFDRLLKIVKESLRCSNKDLQHTLIDTIGEISRVKIETVQLPVMKLLLYFIMIPTSNYHWIAINAFRELAKLHKLTVFNLYQKYRDELCKEIVRLCAINQSLINWNLNESLEKVALMLEFFDCKDYVNQNSHLMLAYLIPLVVVMPKLTLLIEEISTLTDVDLPELLSSKYGYIFLQTFLYQSDDIFRQCMNYVENITKTNGVLLRKRNFKTILNELLLNFDERNDRVIQALKLLTQEENETDYINIQQVADYIQPKFLGVLQYFDLKLISRDSDKIKVICSLSKIFKFMGTKRITPLRFKIIAMLRTALNLNYADFPQLNCDVWNSFIRTCDIEALGPQLATIFISLLPLRESHQKEIYSVYKYLLIDNEKALKDYLLDLFFLLDYDLESDLLLVIRKHVREFERSTFESQLRTFLKYLTHETIDVKICAFKYMKKLLERNREELDRMILGYNGIDTLIVELIDILTLGCREKDAALKLACGECFGELGAIEPSHLPRRQNEELQAFPFYINEDTFITNSLNELVRALQAEKNTQSMDRFSLAIQETIKLYGISPDPRSVRHSVWQSFPEAHQELMSPLLSSRYTMMQYVDAVKTYPIYGSNFGNSFQLWIHNWVTSLISTLDKDKESFLKACLPSLKEDHRLLMQFLPHILLHSLLDGNEVDVENAYVEITTVLNSFNTKRQLDPNILEIRPLKSLNSTYTKKTITSNNERQIQCNKVVFILLDFLDRWKREWEWQKGASGRNDVNYKKIQLFLSRFCKLKLSERNYECGEYSRSLMYIEDYITKNPGNLDVHLHFLAEIYAKLSEADGVAGVAAKRQNEPTLDERILALEVSGKLADAVACYERMEQPMKIHHLKGLVQCYLDLDNVNTALYLAMNETELQLELLEVQAEPLWRLGRYEDLNELLERRELQKNKSWGVQVGRALLNFRNGKREEFKMMLNELKMQQVQLFGSSSLEEGAYKQGYNCIAKLHSLNELERIENVANELLSYSNNKTTCKNVVQKLISELQLRLKVVEQSIKITEPILCLRRVAIDQAKHIVKNQSSHSLPLLDSLLGETWLLSAKSARVAGVHQQSYSYSIKAEEYSPPCLFIEKAKLHWCRLEHEQALATLKRGLERIYNPPTTLSGRLIIDTKTLSETERKLWAKAKLLIARYNAAISNVEAEVNIRHYRDAADTFKECEKSHVLLGQYYDKVFQNLSDEDREKDEKDMQLHMIDVFGRSLQYGTNYVYQSMPRLLSIWFDYGTRLLDVNVESIRKERQKRLSQMTKLIGSFLDRLPTFIFLTCFSQLVSRICHPQKEVYAQLKSIIVKVMLSYPQHTMWMLMSVIKSSSAIRSKRCNEILMDSRLKTPHMSKLVTDFTNLATKLIELCHKTVVDNATIISVNSLLKSLPRLLTNPGFSEIMIPTQKFRKLVLPNPDFKTDQHNPFPNHYVHVVGIKDEMVILQSLQKPRRITLRGSDGKTYIQMLKPNDDLRKDFRLMEFNDVVNQLLCAESESRQRRLNIRLYSVVPLNEECGMLEWVPNLIGLRPILHNIYKQRGLGMSGKELLEKAAHKIDPLVKKKEIFINKLLPRYPPVLGDWFRKTFPDAQGWLTARTAFIRTTAVMSMVGYILGLGDRHGENVLLDATCGDTVHVDFNCLFNKGESFEWPERVPFRLTQNMVAAMGPLGVEGVFRISCACTLRVLRNNIHTLMSIVRPFVYDPLVTWPQTAASAVSKHNAELTNDKAVDYIRNVELRLQGMIKGNLSMALSVEGQTDNLIKEAMSIENLCQMYIGWGAYL